MHKQKVLMLRLKRTTVRKSRCLHVYFPTVKSKQQINLCASHAVGFHDDTCSVALSGIKDAMGFNFKLGLVLVTSDCGITAECDMDKLVNTTAALINMPHYVLVQKRKV